MTNQQESPSQSPLSSSAQQQQPQQQQPSLVLNVLTDSRQELWKAHHLPAAIHHLRIFLVDPCLQFWSVVLPFAVDRLGLDRPVAFLLKYAVYQPLRWSLKLFSRRQPELSVRSTAKAELLQQTQPPIHFQPPTDLQSACLGGFAFVFSVAADIVGAFLDRRKLTKWLEAVTAFRAYLAQSGVGAELEEAMMKPLFRGRLLSNVKILNDIQETKDEARLQLQVTKREHVVDSLRRPLLDGCRYMRFATAAYGSTMVKSAVDRQASHQDIEDDYKSIAFHTGVSLQDDDIKYLSPPSDMKILQHYVAVDHASKSVVLAIRGTLSISGALVDMQAMDCDYCGGRAHKGIAEQADNIWAESGARIMAVLDAEYPDYSFIITGHSLGAGAACLLQMKIYYENLIPRGPERKVLCYGFAPPPVFSLCNEPSEAIQNAIENCVCYVHDNDCVPLLSVSSIRRLADLMDAVDNETEHIWFWRRFRIFWEYEDTPVQIVDAVAKASSNEKKRTIGECEMIIPARVVVWMKKNFAGQYEALACSPEEMANLNIFVCQDMVSDHLPEQYEDALDILVEKLQEDE